MKKINIIGLGAGDLQQMPIGVYQELKQAKHLFLRTKEHPVVETLEQEGITYLSFDHLYEQFEQFERVYEQIVAVLMEQVLEKELIYYAVPGHPLVAERTVQLLLEKAQAGELEVEVRGGQSFIDPLLARLGVDPIEGLLLVDGTSLPPDSLHPQWHTLITQVYDHMVASEVKLTLMEIYPDDYPITVATAVGIAEQENIVHVPLYELDRVTTLSNLTAVFVPATEEESILNRHYSRTRHIFRTLRGPEGCPWDREQTHQTLKKYLIEEANEVLEAIDEEDPDHLLEELGDLLLQVFLHAQIAEDEGYFNMEDILASLNEKMVRRHPHVFGDTQIESSEQLAELWQQIKDQEKNQEN